MAVRPGIPRPYTGDTTTSSGIVSADGVVCDHECILMALLIFTDGINEVTATIYDNATAASGTVLAKVRANGDELIGGEVNINCMAINGLYIDVAGTGGTALCRFIP